MATAAVRKKGAVKLLREDEISKLACATRERVTGDLGVEEYKTEESGKGWLELWRLEKLNHGGAQGGFETRREYKRERS